MTIVKGIIVTFGINEQKKDTCNYILSESVSADSVDYEVKDNLLYVKFSLKIAGSRKVKDKKGDELSKLVSRKQFLDSVFVSAQFLTDYFLMKNQLNT